MSDTLTEEEREWRAEMVKSLTELNAAILAINGPHAETEKALSALKNVSNLAIDDEDLGPCESCGEHIWMLADDDYVANEDGDRFCATCVNRWNEDSPEQP